MPVDPGAPCRCGGEGLSWKGFHYPYAPGCTLPREAKPDATAYVPSREEAAASERFHAYRIGWIDGAKSAEAQDRFARHATRPDIRARYIAGYQAGTAARLAAMSAAALADGYEPSALR